MQDSIYSAVFGALSSEHRLNIIANNLANVNTTGFKRDETTFKDVFKPFAHDYILDSKADLRAKPLWPDATTLAKPRLVEEKVNFSQGTLMPTGNALDLAIQGEGFFKIQTPAGVRYTRAGSFKLNSEGQIVDGAGRALMADGGPITIPPNSKVEIAPDGAISANGEQLSSVTVVRFDDDKVLEKEGSNLFKLKEGKQAAELPAMENQTLADGTVVPGSTVNQGYLESPNVEVVSEMVRMIEVQRVFEAYQKTMRTAQDMDTRMFSMVGKSV